jgi:Flp pilus assembly protein TadD
MLEDLHGAEADCTKALTIDPKNPVVLTARGQAKIRLGQYRDAIADCTEALKIAPTNPEALAARGTARNYLGDVARNERTKNGPNAKCSDAHGSHTMVGLVAFVNTTPG